MACIFAHPTVSRRRDCDVHFVHLELLARGDIVRQVARKGEMVMVILFYIVLTIIVALWVWYLIQEMKRPLFEEDNDTW